MSELRRMRDDVPLGLSPEALSADDPRDLVDYEDDVHAERVADGYDLDALDALIVDAMHSFAPSDTSVDRAITVPLHKLLPLGRGLAGDRRVWAWLGLCKYPHFVAHRWARSQTTGQRPAERFYGDKVRQTFARLWWAAELTADGDDYSLTERLLALSGFQDFAEAVFGRAFCGYRPSLVAFVDLVGRRPERVVRETAKQFNYLLTTVVLETLSESQLRAELADLVEQVEHRA